MIESTDQVQHTIRLENPPRRIVSLVPSQTEFLFDIGAGDQVAGVTRFCVYPEKARKEKVLVGGTKNYDIGRIRELEPDLIIANKEENVRASIEELQNEFPVWTSDISSLEDAMEMMLEVGRITGHAPEASRIAEDIRLGFENLPEFSGTRILYFIWKNPYMVVASDTFIDHVLNRIGLTNAAAHMSRYPSLEPREIRDLNPDIILLSTEPFPFRENDAEELAHICPNARIMQVNGEYFSWYGSRLKQAPAYFSRMLMESV